jgi:hypothetical protein
MSIAETRQLHCSFGGQQDCFKADVPMGDVVFVKVGESAEDLCYDTVCFWGWKGPVVGKEGTEVSSCTVGHYEAEFGALVVEDVEDWEDVGVAWMDGCGV